MKLSIVIPVYNEERTLHGLIAEVMKSAEKLAGVSGFELVIVDDASKDLSAEILRTHYSAHPNIRTFFQPVNQGKGAAVRRGFAEASGEIILIQDADLEYDPNDYGVLLAPILSGKADVVFGSRFRGEVQRILFFWHKVANQILTFSSNMLTNLNLSDMETCYKVFRAAVVKEMILTSNRFGIEPEITAKVAKIKGIRIYEVPISYYGRTYEEGKKIGWKDAIAALWFIFKYNVLVGYSDSFKTERSGLLEKLQERRTLV